MLNYFLAVFFLTFSLNMIKNKNYRVFSIVSIGILYLISFLLFKFSIGLLLIVIAVIASFIIQMTFQNRRVYFITSLIILFIMIIFIPIIDVQLYNWVLNWIKRNEIIKLICDNTLLITTLIFLMFPSSLICHEVINRFVIRDQNSQNKYEINESLIIGIFERIVAFLLFVISAPTAIAIIITAKTWVRNPTNSDNDMSVGTFLCGTLISISLSLFAFLVYKLMIS